MKTLRKIDIEKMRAEMPVLKEQEQRQIVGGVDFNSIELNGGGEAISYDLGDNGESYTVVYAPNGDVYFFDGVTVSKGSSPDGSGLQFDGVIYQGKSGLTMNEFIHEYGHYFQEKEKGTGMYVLTVGVESAVKHTLSNDMLKKLFGSDSYYGTGYENDASARGNEYMDTYYPDSPYEAPIE